MSLGCAVGFGLAYLLNSSLLALALNHKSKASLVTQVMMK